MTVSQHREMSMSYKDGLSYTLDGRVYPSLRAMIKANRWATVMGKPEPYPDLASYYDPEVIRTCQEASEPPRSS